MTRRKFAPALFVILATAAVGPADDLDGVWLPDTANAGKTERLGFVWNSTLTITGRSYALSKFMDVKADLKGTFTTDPADPKHIDIVSDGLDLSATGMPLKVPATTWHGLYERTGDRFKVTFDRKGGRRPAKFGETGDTIISLTFVQAPAGFKAIPKEVAVTVRTPDGKPAAGVTVAGFMMTERPESGRGPRDWRYRNDTKTGADGVAKVKVADHLRSGGVVARDPAAGLMAVRGPSPASLTAGTLSVTLEPECRMVGTLTCEALTKLGRPVGSGVIIISRDGKEFSAVYTRNDRFECVLPPGEFSLYVHAGNTLSKTVPVSVPPGRRELDIGPIPLTATSLALMEGRPAPEFTGVVGWKGEPVTLAGLRGKVVILDFWSYGCGGCVVDMPKLFDLHEKYADQGLAVVGVHLDAEGEVDTAAKLDEMVAGFRKELWKGKDFPFPVALTSGVRAGDAEGTFGGRAAAQYGVNALPTTLLIDRAGNVVGQIGVHNPKAATEQIEKLLAEKK